MILCDLCKVRPATYHSLKKINGISNEQHLCEECRLKQLASASKPDIDNLFAGFNSLFELPRRSVLRCSKCGTSAEEFMDSGCVGCAECYTELESVVAPVIQRVQNGMMHTGKSAASSNGTPSTISERERLSIELDKAVKSENFEQALIIRDKLKELKD